MSRFAGALSRIKGDVTRAVPAALIRRATAAVGHTGRDRVLDPVATTHLALHRALHGGTATRNHRCQTMQELLDLTFYWFEARTHFRGGGLKAARRSVAVAESSAR